MANLIYDIKDYVEEVTIDDDDDVDFGSLSKDVSILHQQEYIDELYQGFISNYTNHNLTLQEFKIIYNNILITSRKKISKAILKDPSLYSKYKEYYDLDVPEWIKKTNKYNL
jgi:hypothetical protein